MTVPRSVCTPLADRIWFERPVCSAQRLLHPGLGAAAPRGRGERWALFDGCSAVAGNMKLKRNMSFQMTWAKEQLFWERQRSTVAPAKE